MIIIIIILNNDVYRIACSASKLTDLTRGISRTCVEYTKLLKISKKLKLTWSKFEDDISIFRVYVSRRITLHHCACLHGVYSIALWWRWSVKTDNIILSMNRRNRRPIQPMEFFSSKIEIQICKNTSKICSFICQTVEELEYVRPEVFHARMRRAGKIIWVNLGTGIT